MIEYNTTAGDPKKFDRNFGFCWSVFSILFILWSLLFVGLFITQMYWFLFSHIRIQPIRYIILWTTALICFPFVIYENYSKKLDLICYARRETMEYQEPHDCREHTGKRYDISRMSNLKVKTITGLLKFSMWYMQFMTFAIILAGLFWIIYYRNNIIELITLKAIWISIIILLIIVIIIISQKKK